MREIYIFSEKITDKALNNLFVNSILPKNGNLDLNVKTDLEELNRILKDDLNLSDDDTSVMILQESDIDIAAFDAVYSSPVGRYTPATIEGKAGFVAMQESTVNIFPLARLILAIYKRLEGARPSQSPEPESIRTTRIATFTARDGIDITYPTEGIPQNLPIRSYNNVILRQCVDRLDSWLDENPKGKITPAQLLDLWFERYPTPKQLAALDLIIDFINTSKCIVIRKHGERTQRLKGQLAYITTFEESLNVNGAIVDKYYLIEQKSLISKYADETKDIINIEVPGVPIFRRKVGEKMTDTKLMCGYLLAIAATKQESISLLDIYEATGADTKKKRFDVRNDVISIIDTNFKGQAKYFDDTGKEVKVDTRKEKSKDNSKYIASIDFTQKRD